MTTGMPSSLAASSLPAVSWPPLFLVTRTSMPWRRIRARSASRAYGPRASSTSQRAGIGAAGGSTQRIRNQSRSSAANDARLCRPVVRKTRVPSPGSIFAASASDPAPCQSSPSRGSQAGRVSRSSGSPACAQASAACALIVSANGCVASTTASMPSARAQAARPPAPPKPPTRTSPTGSTGSRTRPASELTTRRPGRPASSAASSRASDVPPSTSTVSTPAPALTMPRSSGPGRTSRPARAAEQVAVHDPALARPRVAADGLNLVRDVAQLPGQQDLVLGAEVSAPVNLYSGSVDAGERAAAVQHHHHVVAVLGEALFGQPASGGDVHGLADLGQAHPVPGRQRLDAADPRDDLVLQLHRAHGDHLLDDGERAVVQRGIAPDQEGAALPVTELVPDERRVDLGPLAAPLLDGCAVRGRRAVPLGVWHLHHPVGPVLHVPLANLLPCQHQVLLDGALVDHEEHVGLVECLDRLHGDLLGVTRADPDDEQPFHGRGSSLPPGRAARAPRAGSAARPHRASSPAPRPRPGSPRHSAAAGPRRPDRRSAPPDAGQGCSPWPRGWRDPRRRASGSPAPRSG